MQKIASLALPKPIPSLLRALACVLFATPGLAAQDRNPELKHSVLVGAKLQLCEGLLDDNVEYYLETHSPKRYEELRRLTEFGDARRKEILQEGRERFVKDAAARFTPGQTYAIRDLEGRLSLYDKSSGGFWESVAPSISYEHSSADDRFAGARKLADDERAVDVLYSYARPSRFLFSPPVRTMVSGTARRDVISLRLSFALQDSLALNLVPGRPELFVPMPEDRAAKIAAYYGEASGSNRRTFGNVDVKIVECVSDPRRKSHLLVAEVVGFEYFAAKLEEKLWDAKPTWKRKDLLISWTRPQS